VDKLPTPAHPFGADTLACALTLTGSPYPTPAQLDAALLGMYPVGGPTAASLVAAGWLLPTIDKKGLRYPPLTHAEVDARLADYECEAKATLSEHPERADSPPEAAGAAPLFSYYRGPITNQIPYATITPAQFFSVLTSGRCRAATEALRAAPVGSPQRAELKKSLDYVTPAGTFTRRANDALLKPSGLLPLDFDHMPDVAAARAALLADALLAPDLVLLFTSPSGDGLKAFVRTDPTAAHLDNFRAYADYLAAHYAPLGLSPDAAGKDVARACFVPYAPDAWLAPAYAA
jgi:hypothetical protein